MKQQYKINLKNKAYNFKKFISFQDRVRLTGKGIDFRSLQAGREVEFELNNNNNDTDFYNYEDENEKLIDYEKVFKYRNADMLNCGEEEEEEGDEGQGDEARYLCTPFDRLREKMDSVIAEGGVMKRVLESGTGSVIPIGSRVRSTLS